MSRAFDSADVLVRLRRLCDKAVLSLPAAGAGLTVPADQSRDGLVAATGPASERLEEVQVALGEGPCVDATADGRPVLVARLDPVGPRRWPRYTSVAREFGVRAVFAFPLQVGAARLGVLDFFRTSEGDLTRPELGRAFAMADEAVAILLDGPLPAGPADGDPAGSPEVFQAQGMVMVQAGGTLPEAMARMRAHAYAENLRLTDVARAVVDRKLRFQRDG